MAQQKGLRLYIKEGQRIFPGLMFFPRKAGVLYSVTFFTGAKWRGQSLTCFEIRATNLSIKQEGDMICPFLAFPDTGECLLFSFPEKSIVGITDLDDQDIVPEVAPQSLFGKPDPRRFYISPLQRPIQEILRDSLKPVTTPPFLPHSHDV